MKKLTTEDFIEKSMNVHHDKYDYSNTIYNGMYNKVEILCNSCKTTFNQLPANHIHNKQGCPICNLKKQFSLNELLHEFNLVHNDRYDYSKITSYNGIDAKLDIVCVEHGLFKMSAYNHLYRKQKCPHCSKVGKPNTKEFVEKSNIIHNNKYKYDKSVYTSSHKKVIITCAKHGDFEITPSHHIYDKRGCPRCTAKSFVSKSELDLVEYVKSIVDVDCEIVTNKSPDFFPNSQHLDIYIQKLKLAFEFNGNYWHSEQFNKDEEYHTNKFYWCYAANVLLIHVWESQWRDEQYGLKELIRQIVNAKYTIDTIPEDIFSKVKEMVWLK